MFKGKKVKIRLKRFIPEQRIRVFVGEVLEMTEGWLKVDGKFFTLAKGERMPRVDEYRRILGIPRESIRTVRVLPDNTNLDNLKYKIKDSRLVIELDSNQPVSISE